MYEIKKIKAKSLAKYVSVITAVLVFVLGFFNLILDHLGWGYNLEIGSNYKFLNLIISVLFFYVFSWLLGYLTAIIYNLVAKKSSALTMEFQLKDMSLLDFEETEKEANFKNVFEKKE